MGCGTSKSAKVVERDITIQAILSVDHLEESPDAGPTSGEDEETPPPLGQEAKALEQVTSGSEQSTTGDTSEGRRFDAFDVCFGDNGLTSTKGLPPRRLSKLESVPKLTAEMLAEKQRLADERKVQELEKRASRKLSRKDRLRKQINEAKELEMAQQHYTQIEKKQSASSLNKAKLQAEAAEKQRKREEHAQRVREKANQQSTEEELDSESETASFNPYVEMEVDHTYNTDTQNAEFWDAPSSENSLDTNNQRTKLSHDSDDFFNN